MAGYGSGSQERSPDYPNAQTRVVQNCTDHDPDSLRDILENPNNPNHALSGDTVDLSQLPTLCGMANATITLTTGEITIYQQDLQLRGVSLDQNAVMISGGGTSRVFRNIASAGTLSIYDLTIADGYHHAMNNAEGGCIESEGSISLHSATVTGCKASSDTAYALGGGIHAALDVTLVFSTVSANEAIAPAGRGCGGGVYGNAVSAKYSSITGNTADGAFYGVTSTGGGIFATASVSIRGSTIDDNTAGFASALRFTGASNIYNSTISGNVARSGFAVLTNPAAISLTIANSTIAFNHSENDIPGPGSAVFFEGSTANSALTLQSSIIANNTVGAGNTPSDIYVKPGFGVLSGADNLVIGSNVSDPVVITVTNDPQLGPLQFNGGPTKTHALLRNSPALAVGNNNAGLLVDQRGTGYPRTTGPNAEVDIGAFEFDSIFAAGFDN
jgi:hypothetical protein